MSNISFFTPVVFEKDRTARQYLLEKVDGYFSLGGKRAFVISGNKSDQNYDVQMKDYKSGAISKLLFTTLKIISYLTIVLPVFMIISKLVLRANYSFKLTEVKDLTRSSSEAEKSSAVQQQTGLLEKDIFAFGDVHGELDGLIDNLKEAKILDKQNNWVTGNKSIVIQMGDEIDRGPKPLETYDFSEKLQIQAEANGGKFIRLLGNHEEMILQKNYYFAMASGLTFEQCEKLRERLIHDIGSDKITLSWTDGERLYTHAGLRSIIQENLEKEILSKRRGFFGFGRLSSDALTYQDIVNHLNSILKKAVISNDFSHDVFKVGKERGGDSPYGGVLWGDGRKMFASKRADAIKQVFAHTPPGPNDQPIRYTPSLRLINVDAGLCKLIGNNNAFIQFKGKKVFVHEKVSSFFHLKKWKVREVKEVA